MSSKELPKNNFFQQTFCLNFNEFTISFVKRDNLAAFMEALDEGQKRYCGNRLAADAAAVKRGHLALFNAMQARRKDPSKKLRKELQEFPISRNLAVEKYRLFEKLIGYVKELGLARKKVSDQRQRLEQAEVLFDMGLWPEAAEATQKGIQKAVHLEDLHMEVLLRDLLRKIYKNMSQSELVDEITHNEYSLVMASRKLATLMRYNQINDRMFAYQRKFRVSDSNSIKRGLEELLASPEMKDINKADSLPSQIRFYTIMNNYHSQLNDGEKCIEVGERLIALWEQKPERLETDTAEYRAALTNQIGHLSMLGRLTEAERLLSKLDSLPVSGGKSAVLQFVAVELHHQLFYLNQGKFRKAAERESKIVEGLKRFKKSIANSSHLALLYNLGVTHLVLGNTGKAIQYFDRIRGLGKLPERQDLQGVARLLRLLLMAEKRTEMNFEHYLRNSQRFFGKKDRGYKLELAVHDWLIRFERTGVNKEKELLKEFISLLEPMVATRVLGAEEMLLWGKARLVNKRVEQIFIERLKKT